MPEYIHHYILDVIFTSENENPSEDEILQALKERAEGVESDQAADALDHCSTEEND